MDSFSWLLELTNDIPFAELDFLSCSFDDRKAESEMLDRHKTDGSILNYNGQMARVDMTECGLVEVVQGITGHHEPTYHVIHDYGPAYDYISYYENLYNYNEMPLPAPFEPKAERFDKGLHGYNESVHNICKAFDLHNSAMLNEEIVEKLNFCGHKKKMSDNLFEPQRVYLAFNPFSANGRAMLQSIEFDGDKFLGTYKSVDKIYKFEWHVNHKGYVVNPDIWTGLCKNIVPSLHAYSLVFPEPLAIFSTVHLPKKTEFVVPPLVLPFMRGVPFDVGSPINLVSNISGATYYTDIVLRVPGITYDFNFNFDYVVEVSQEYSCNLIQDSNGKIKTVETFRGSPDFFSDEFVNVSASVIPYSDFLVRYGKKMKAHNLNFSIDNVLLSTLGDGVPHAESPGNQFIKYKCLYSSHVFYVDKFRDYKNLVLLNSMGRLYIRLTDLTRGFFRNVNPSVAAHRVFLSPFSAVSNLCVSSDFSAVFEALMSLDTKTQLLMRAQYFSDSFDDSILEACYKEAFS